VMSDVELMWRRVAKAMWGEGITKDNFDAFVWRGATAAAERLWSTEESLGCSSQQCPGIDPSNVRPGPSHWLSSDSGRLSDQLCRMSRRGIRTGPIAPGFCPSDSESAASALETQIWIVEEENVRLKLELQKLRRRG